MKKCCRCKKEKTLDSFHNHKKEKDGKAKQCKACRKDYLMNSGRKCELCNEKIDRRSVMDRCANCKNIGRVFSEERNKRVSKSKTGEKNPMWKGDNVGYTALHEWVKRRLKKPQKCNDCNDKPYDLANISQEYKRELSDWEWLCRRCHMTKDGRLEDFRSYGKNNENGCGKIKKSKGGASL